MTINQNALQEVIRSAARIAVATYLADHGVAKQWDLVQAIKSVQGDFGIDTTQFSTKPYRYIREFKAENLFKELSFVDLVSGETYSLYARNTLGVKF